MGSNPDSTVSCCVALDESLGVCGPLVSHLENVIIITGFLEIVVARSCCCFCSWLLLAYMASWYELENGIPSSSRCVWGQGAWLAEQIRGRILFPV